MNYSQLREEIGKMFNDAPIDYEFRMTKRIMTAIDTYLEEKAAEVEKKRDEITNVGEWESGYYAAKNDDLHIIRSKE